MSHLYRNSLQEYFHILLSLLALCLVRSWICQKILPAWRADCIKAGYSFPFSACFLRLFPTNFQRTESVALSSSEDERTTDHHVEFIYNSGLGLFSKNSTLMKVGIKRMIHFYFLFIFNSYRQAGSLPPSHLSCRQKETESRKGKYPYQSNKKHSGFKPDFFFLFFFQVFFTQHLKLRTKKEAISWLKNKMKIWTATINDTTCSSFL